MSAPPPTANGRSTRRSRRLVNYDETDTSETPKALERYLDKLHKENEALPTFLQTDAEPRTR